MNKDYSIEDLVRERNEMLTTLDIATFRAYMNKYNPGEDDYDNMPEGKIFHSMHLARLQVESIPEHLKEESRGWLKARGLRTYEEGPPNA